MSWPRRVHRIMDIERCVELHNKILRHGYIGTGKDPNEFGTHGLPCRYLSRYIDTLEDVSDDISDDLLAFFSQARTSPDHPTTYDESGHLPANRSFAFHPLDSGLPGPRALSGDTETWIHDVEPGNEKIYLTLYHPNSDAGSHPLGLVHDQRLNRAVCLPTIDDTERAFAKTEYARSLWRPLE